MMPLRSFTVIRLNVVSTARRPLLRDVTSATKGASTLTRCLGMGNYMVRTILILQRVISGMLQIRDR